MSDEPLRRTAVLPDGPAAAVRLIEPLLAQAVGLGAEPVSLTLDYGAPAEPGDAVIVEAGVERATRTLVFAFARLLSPEGNVLAAASAIYRRSAEASKAA